MNAQWQRRFAPLVAQVRANPRLQVGLAAIVVIVVGWGVLALGDAREAAVGKMFQAQQRYAQVRQLSGQDVWTQRAADAGQLADALEAEIPPARSPGLAQATFQGWVKTIVDSQGTPIRLDLQAPVRLDAPNADIVRITAVVAGTMDPRRTWDMIHRFEASTALVAIPEITVRSDGANQTFSVTLQGFYRVPPDQGTAP
ncbi:MAG: hypothetical protein ACTHOC_02120 [Luteimonas sp.]